jgi:hypothetical protein
MNSTRRDVLAECRTLLCQPAQDWPPVLVPFFAFRIMVGSVWLCWGWLGLVRPSARCAKRTHAAGAGIRSRWSRIVARTVKSRQFNQSFFHITSLHFVRDSNRDLRLRYEVDGRAGLRRKLADQSVGPINSK